jgi:uncharacterized membrane protein
MLKAENLAVFFLEQGNHFDTILFVLLTLVSTYTGLLLQMRSMVNFLFCHSD